MSSTCNIWSAIDANTNRRSVRFTSRAPCEPLADVWLTTSVYTSSSATILRVFVCIFSNCFCASICAILRSITAGNLLNSTSSSIRPKFALENVGSFSSALIISLRSSALVESFFFASKITLPPALVVMIIMFPAKLTTRPPSAPVCSCPSSVTDSIVFMTSLIDLSISSMRIIEFGFDHAIYDNRFTKLCTWSTDVKIDRSIRCSGICNSSEMILTISVLPTPDGPMNIIESNGFVGSVNPALLVPSARQTMSIGSCCPIRLSSNRVRSRRKSTWWSMSMWNLRITTRCNTW